MNVTSISKHSFPTVFTHSSIVMGVIQNRQSLDELIDVLGELGITEFEILEGESGMSFLQQQEHSFKGFMEFYLGEMETRTRFEYSREVAIGNLIFAVAVSSTNKAAVIQSVQRLDAKFVVYFGWFANESYPTLPIVINPLPGFQIQ